MKKQLGALLAVVPLTLGLAACGNSGSSDSSDKTVKIAVVDQNDANKELVKEAKKQGIDVQLLNLTDYNQPNPQTKSGEVDLNWFQHIQYLANYNVKNHDDLAIVGGTSVYPMGLYSKKHKSVSEVPQGGTIAIPNDSVNETRALLILKSAGLLTMKNDKSLPSVKDIDTDKSKVTVKSVDATQTALSLGSVDGSVINNDFLEKANISPDDAIAKDDAKSDTALPYVNLFVSKKDKQDDPTFKKIVDIYHSDAVQAKEKEISKGTAVEIKDDAKKLRDKEAEVEKEIKANQ